jgi:hypothetical protein
LKPWVGSNLVAIVARSGMRSAASRCSQRQSTFVDASGPPTKPPSDEEWTDDVLWRNLIEGQATVLVGEDTELLLVPLRRGVIDRLRGRVPVSVAPRTHGHASSYATLSRLGRHPV